MTISIPEVPIGFEGTHRSWFFEQDPRDLAEVAARERCEAWLKPFAGWLAGEASALPPWHGRGVPIVAVPAQLAVEREGRLGIVDVELVRGAGNGGSADQFPVLGQIAGAFAILLDGRSPSLDSAVPDDSDGDSASLSIAVAALQAIFGGTLDPRFGFSGCWDAKSRSLTPPEPSSIPAKLETIRRWGMRTLVVPTGKGSTSPATEGVLEAPGAIPELFAFLISEGILALPDDRMIDVVVMIDFESKGGRSAEAFLPLLERITRCGSVAARSLASGLVGRYHLHRGETEASSPWLDRERELGGLDYLPESPVKEYVLFERHAVRSIAAIDLGELDDEVEDHQAIDRLIAELAGRKISYHEEFMRFALLNSRARRSDYLGRLHADSDRFDQAWSDLMALRGRWPAIVEFVTGRLGRRDTSIARIENQCIDLLNARHELAQADPSRGPVPANWLVVARGFSRSTTPADGLATFDLLSWLKLRAVLDGGVEAADLRTAAETLGVLGEEPGGANPVPNALYHPDFVSLEWLLRLDREHALPTEHLAAVLERTIAAMTQRDGIFRILALRSAAVLQVHAGRRDALSLVPESGIASLRSLRTAIVGDGEPEGIMRRCPY